MSKRPDAEAIIEQLLLSYRATRKHHILRRRSLGAGGRGMLRAAGIAGDRARAIDLMARRVTDDWRRHKVEPGPAQLDAEIERLLT